MWAWFQVDRATHIQMVVYVRLTFLDDPFQE